MAYRAVLVDVDYDPARRRAVVRDVVGETMDLPTSAFAEAAAGQLLVEGGPPRADRHAVVVDTRAPGAVVVVAIVELDPGLEPVVLRPRAADDPGPSAEHLAVPLPPGARLVEWDPPPPPTRPPGSDVAYARSRHGYWLLVATGVLGGLAAAGMLLGAEDGVLWPPAARLVAGVAVVLALVCLAIGLRHLASRRPALELHADGLVDRTRMRPTRRVAWSDVTAVDVARPRRPRVRWVTWIAGRLPDVTSLVLDRREGRPVVIALGPVGTNPRDVAAQVAVHWRGGAPPA